MKLVQFTHKKSPNHLSVGVLTEDNTVVDVSHIACSGLDLISGGDDMLEKVSIYVQNAVGGFNLDDVNLKAPVTGMDKVLCIGMNYRDHCEEQNMPIPKEPLVFNKFPSCVIGPYDDIPYPPETKELDWEVELVVVVGRAGFQIPEAESMNYVFGYAVGHDVSARDWQLKRNGGQWMVGKGMPGFAPIGPCIVTRDCLPDPTNLSLYCKVNGVTKQDSSTKEMVFNIPQIIAWVSKFFKILPGDIIFTGTPPGVGVFKSPPELLKSGDTVLCGVQGIGEIENKIV